MPEKFDRCVSKVKAGGGVDNPYAVCNASINENQEGGQGSGRKPYKQKAHDQPSFLPPAKTPRAKPAMPSRVKKGPMEVRPLIKELDEMIVRLRENNTVKSMPNTPGLEGKDWPNPDQYTPTEFSKIDAEQKLKEDMGGCEVCGLPNEYHSEITDHPYIPNMNNEMGMGGHNGGMNGQMPPEPVPAIMPPPQPMPQENNMPPIPMPPPMPQENNMPMPPPPPMPQPMTPQNSMGPQQQEHGQQYTVSIPGGLGNVKIGGKKVNEMIREIDQFIQT